MKTERADATLKQVAAKYNVSVDEVVREIDEAIAQALADPDPAVRLLWDRLFSVGHVPSASELITRLAERLNGQ